MIILANNNDKIEAVLTASITTNQLQCYSSYRDITCNEYTPGNQASITNNTTDVEIVGGPAVRTQRVIDMLSIFNSDTVSASVTLKFQNVTNEYILFKATLGTGELLTWNEGKGWQQFDIYGKNFFPANNDVTHEFKAVGIYQHKRFDASITWIYATGKPYTAFRGLYHYLVRWHNRKLFLCFRQK